MEKVRIGNDIQVKYTVLRDGLPESFVGATNIVVEVRNEAYGKIIPSTFNIVGNIVNIILDAKDCVLCGKHRVTLSYNRGNDITIDSLAFELVQFTSQTGGTEIVGVELVIVNISGDIGIAIPDNNKIDLNGLNSNIDKLHFKPDTLVALSEIGDVRYSPESKTLEVKVSDTVSIQLGQEMQTRVKNNAGVQINNGQMVYIDSASGANPLAKIASTADADIAQRTFGMATENIASNGFGAITTEGLVRDINTSAFAEGAILWLGTNGAVTNIEPVAPTPKISVGMVLRSNVANGVIYVKIRAIARNQKLSDVYAPTLTGGDVLRWNSTTLRFETFNVTTALAGKVSTTGNETIAGIKTFSSSPIVPAPTSDLQAATKKYADDLNNTAVHKTGAETVAGVKTFSSSPIVPTPTSDTQATTKKYVDDADALLRADLNNLIATYTHTSNMEVSVTALDNTSGVFTKVGHLLNNGNEISAMLNYNLGSIAAINVFPSSMPNEKYFVVNATLDTFQISATNGGAPVTFADNPTMDLTKWHFEKITNPPITFTNVGGLRNCRLCISHRSLITAQFYLALAYSNSFTNASEVLSVDVLSAYSAIQLPKSHWGFLDIFLNFDPVIQYRVIGNCVSYSPQIGRMKITSINRYVSVNINPNAINSLTLSNTMLANGAIIKLYKY